MISAEDWPVHAPVQGVTMILQALLTRQTGPHSPRTLTSIKPIPQPILETPLCAASATLTAATPRFLRRLLPRPEHLRAALTTHFATETQVTGRLSWITTPKQTPLPNLIQSAHSATRRPDRSRISVPGAATIATLEAALILIQIADPAMQTHRTMATLWETIFPTVMETMVETTILSVPSATVPREADPVLTTMNPLNHSWIYLCHSLEPPHRSHATARAMMRITTIGNGIDGFRDYGVV